MSHVRMTRNRKRALLDTSGKVACGALLVLLGACGAGTESNPNDGAATDEQSSSMMSEASGNTEASPQTDGSSDQGGLPPTTSPPPASPPPATNPPPASPPPATNPPPASPPPATNPPPASPPPATNPPPGPWSLPASGVVSSGGGNPNGAPYPASDLVTSATWAPTSSIIRLARDSDNWPVTWGADGDLYTAYGDGHGFTPEVPTKLSLGHGKVIGSPPNITGFNTYPTNADFQGQGPYGKKASSLLMVDNALYMWIRNADNNGNGCQVGRSLNQGTTWEFASWTFNELGYCTFLNFGQNYAGALDGYVYTYSHNSPSAYANADNFVLMRVPKAQILNRQAYEFVSGYNGSTPTWSSQISQRAAVFTHAGRSWRSGISYNAGLGRYIWWQQNVANGVDARFSNVGFGVYESTTPWGPWKTIYFTDAWDTGPGETAMFPTKWMSANGREMYLVFSGNDQFSVRKLTLTTN